MRLAFILLCAVVVGCSSNNAYKPDGGHVDALTYDLSLDLPPGCPPGQGNEKGVGKPCTRNGHECGSPLICACDTVSGLTLNGLPCICTMAGLDRTPSNPDPCSLEPSDICGSGATCCNYLSTAFYCSPNVCLPGGECIQFSAADAGH
ncbi:MAG TPA: hypothetical protein VMT03_24650 [Polyangia bacterium]|nr:hypothetical protein [Polyangia bacterium]